MAYGLWWKNINFCLVLGPTTHGNRDFIILQSHSECPVADYMMKEQDYEQRACGHCEHASIHVEFEDRTNLEPKISPESKTKNPRIGNPNLAKQEQKKTRIRNKHTRIRYKKPRIRSKKCESETKICESESKNSSNQKPITFESLRDLTQAEWKSNILFLKAQLSNAQFESLKPQLLNTSSDILQWIGVSCLQGSNSPPRHMTNTLHEIVPSTCIYQGAHPPPPLTTTLHEIYLLTSPRKGPDLPPSDHYVEWFFSLQLLL